jgi:hypothetical protein
MPRTIVLGQKRMDSSRLQEVHFNRLFIAEALSSLSSLNSLNSLNSHIFCTASPIREESLDRSILLPGRDLGVPQYTLRR